MTLPDDLPRPDPRSLPLFESRARRTAPPTGDDPALRRPGRVRSSFGMHLVDASDARREPSARREVDEVIDWKLVAAFRSQASEQLTKALARTGSAPTGPPRKRWAARSSWSCWRPRPPRR